MKPVIFSKTIWFAVILAVLSALQASILSLPLSAQTQGMIGGIIALAITVLRALTNEPLAMPGAKPDEKPAVKE